MSGVAHLNRAALFLRKAQGRLNLLSLVAGSGHHTTLPSSVDNVNTRRFQKRTLGSDLVAKLESGSKKVTRRREVLFEAPVASG